MQLNDESATEQGNYLAHAGAGDFVDSTAPQVTLAISPAACTTACVREMQRRQESPVVSSAIEFHGNQQFSVTAITNSSANVVERYAYQAYGEPTITDASGSVISSSSIGNRYTYTGREWDGTVGLYHFRARWMSGLTGRFLTRDPMKYTGSPWDLYEFLNSRPTSSTDPSGHSGGAPGSGYRRCCGTALVDIRTECCDGGTVVPHRSCESCCQVILPSVINSPRIDFGFIVCCDGRWCACDTRDTWGHILNTRSREIIATCVNRHEQSHFGDDPRPCECNKPVFRGQSRRDENDWNKCRGYHTEYACLGRLIGLCGADENCRRDVEARRGSTVELARGHHRCLTWAW
jgi:RHS repeat-associated protein